MMLKQIITGAAVALSLLSGCSKADEKKVSSQQQTMGAAEIVVGEHHSPYYYGLIEEYKTILAEDPNNLAAIIALGNAYYDSGHWKEAITMYEHALRIDPRNADVRTDMGSSYRNLGMPDRALGEYQIALGYDPAHSDARYNMGIVYAFDKRDYADAIQIWEELLRMSPNYHHAGYMRSNIVTFKKMLKKDAK